MAIRVGINGFGRIGRTVVRAAMHQKNINDFEIVHINDLTDTKTLAHLMKYDSVHGVWDKDVFVDGDSLVADGNKISVSAERNPKDIPWGDKNVDIVFECTGIFRKKDQAQLHIDGGAKKVLISAPAVDEDLTVVMGVNHEKLQASHMIVSNGSCTTNCLGPVAKVIQKNWGIKHGLMTTIHAYTNDQALLDAPHSDLRRARAAATSMIPTSTGAAKAIGLVMPELKGKMDGMAIRVPTPNVSCVDVTFQLAKDTTAEEVNAALKEAAQGELKGVLGFCEEPLVSIDYNGNPHSSFVDASCTTVMAGNMLKVLTWYDNETGFSWRMLDVAKLMNK
jgi:glyceraldehyde 3-phosphate dehydrogenase